MASEYFTPPCTSKLRCCAKLMAYLAFSKARRNLSPALRILVFVIKVAVTMQVIGARGHVNDKIEIGWISPHMIGVSVGWSSFSTSICVLGNDFRSGLRRFRVVRRRSSSSSGAMCRGAARSYLTWNWAWFMPSTKFGLTRIWICRFTVGFLMRLNGFFVYQG